MNYDRIALKQAARDAVRGSRPRSWLVTLVLFLFLLVFPGILRALLPDPVRSLAQMTAYDPGVMDDSRALLQTLGTMSGVIALCFLASAVIALYQSVLFYGYRGYALKLWDGRRTAVGDVFGGFRVLGRALGASAAVGLFTFLWSLIPTVVGGMLIALVNALLGDAAPAAAVVLTVVLALAMAVVVGLISCRYCLTAYFVVDGGLGVFQAVNASKNAMRGSIGKRFALELSFLGWGLLVCLIMVAAAAVTMTVALYITAGALLGAGMSGYGGGGTAALLALLTIPMLIAMVLALAASMPLWLWLMAYRETAAAGFYRGVTGSVGRAGETFGQPFATGGPAARTPDRPAPPLPAPEAPGAYSPFRDPAVPPPREAPPREDAPPPWRP